MRLSALVPLVVPLVVPLAIALPVAGQAGKAAAFTFPDFHQGDGRQQLGEFFGQPVLIATFFDGFNGTGFSGPARKLHEKHADEGLVVVLAIHPLPGVDLSPSAWALRTGVPGDLRICGLPERAPWQWSGTPPYYAVLGPDGSVVAAGNGEKSPKSMEEAVQTALRTASKGWGEGEQAAVRACYARGDLAKARTKAAACGLVEEVDALFERRCGVVRWCLADGQWQRAKQETERLAALAKDVAEWGAAVESLQAEFTGEAAVAELDLDQKLDRLVRPFAKGKVDQQVCKRLRDFAEKNAGTKVGERAARLATLAEQAAAR